jgi:L-fuconolactonase
LSAAPPAFRGNQPRTTAALEAWLARRPREAALEPALPIVDPHHHLWDFPAHGNRYLLDDLLADVRGGHHVVATVFVEAGAMLRAAGPIEWRSLGEVEFATGMAAMADSGGYGPCRVAAGIVAHADLRLGERVGEILEAQSRASGGRLRGIRHQVAHDGGSIGSHIKQRAPEHLLLDPRFQAGFAQLARFGLSFDAWLYHPQLDDLVELAASFPQTTIVLNHVGAPLGVDVFAAHRTETFAAWRKDVARLAACGNVVVKVGGMGMPQFGFGFEQRDVPPSSEELALAWRPLFDVCLESFGPDRCMLESNFPVDKQSGDYNSVWNAFKLMSAALPESDRRALFSGTAARTYRLKI